MADEQELIELYFAMWNATDPRTTHDLVAQIWAADARYVDPRVAVVGREAIAVMVDAVHERLPGVRFRLTSDVDAHSGFLRYGWQMDAPDASVLRTGISIGRLDDAGRLAELIGFFDA